MENLPRHQAPLPLSAAKSLPAAAHPESFDVIFLRNVMIYFPQETRRQVLITMHRSLASDGVLFLGLSEQPRMDSHWQTVLTPKTVWYKPIR
jgi:chemotaxis protein methyltransferase CheR